MVQVLPFSISNEMAVFIGLFGPPLWKWAVAKFSNVVAGAKEYAFFRGIEAWKRERRYKRLKSLRRTRSISALVNEQIAMSNTYFLLFWIVALFYFYLFIGSPIKEVFEIEQWLTIGLASPVYYLEVKWLHASSKKKELLSIMRAKRR